MILLPALSFLLLLTSEGISGLTKCYECGYLEEGHDGIEQIGNLPECGDTVNMESLAVECPKEEDCCLFSVL